MTEPTPVYEQTKQVMGFDPDGMALVVDPPENWNLHQDHPLTVMNRIFELADKLGWTQQQLEQEWEWMAWLSEKERSNVDADESAQQVATATGHIEPQAGSVPAGDPDGDAGQAGTPGPTEGDQAGEVEQVPG